MKRVLSIILALCLCLGGCALGEEAANKTLSVQEWLDTCGEAQGTMVVVVAELLNPVLARVEDETGSVNLFGLIADGQPVSVFDADLQAGDVLVLENARYNVYEGSVEMQDAVLLRKITTCRGLLSSRTVATQYEFTASPSEETIIEGLIFNGDVTVNGEGEAVRFFNCEFHGNIINAALIRTVVWIMPDCELDDGCHCILQNGVKEATIEYSIPKFAMFFPIQVETDCLGGVIAVGMFDVNINEETATATDLQFYQKADGEMIPYEEGMEMQAHVVIWWWENGERCIFTMGVAPDPAE